MIERDGCYLITQRRPNAKFPLLWEFPGGRVEEGEREVDALRRELNERLAVQIEVVSLYSYYTHPYDDCSVDLYLYVCTLGEGELKCQAVHDFRWVPSAELENYPFVGADEASMKKLLEES